MQNKTACEFMEEHVPTAASAAPQDKYKPVGQKRKSRDTGREEEKEEEEDEEEEEEEDTKGKEEEADPRKSKTQWPSEEEERKQFDKLLSRGMQRQLVESQGKEFVAIDIASLLRHSA
jgi:FtsZ-interacting cell division protein YlmF